ncbi:carboxyl-terminal processing protease [Balneicella halophila]|uniref:Carboxyl-terminal processing protease n=1 Tax=Balneicella halophila TaxID=1537566 RepID=A0A7L4UTQ9_BALHA|nr:S41 family peptidase [Balneicella halophila]PVX52634.1 carboxyl-terminal processing protease [Balneicella halophila]
MFKFKIRIFSSLIIGILFTTVLNAQILPQTNQNNEDELRSASFKYHQLLNLLDKVYVDSLNIKDLTEKAIENTLEQLDPHSVYMDEEELKEAEETMSGEFSGIGIQFNILRDTLMVVSTVNGGPSEKVGLRAGDRIVKINDEKVTNIGLTNSGVAKRLRGEKGTKVTVYVERKNTPKVLDFLIIRDDIPLNTVDAAYMINGNIGYVKVNRFGQKTPDEFHEALQKLKEQGMEKLLLDLTGNGGGYLGAAVQMLDEFMEVLKLAVYVEGLHSPRRDFMTMNTGLIEDAPVVVMIDESSASASEIVAGAVQDWDRGVLVGRRSFGKGLVQNQFAMPDGSAVRITTGHYYTPSGRNIQKSYENGSKDYYSEVFKRYEHGEMINPDSIEFPDSLKFETLVNKRTVYGGGGIMPDVFVPLDTTKNFSYLNALYRKNIIYPYTIDYVDLHRADLITKYSNLEIFNNEFEVTEAILEEVYQAGLKEDIERKDEDYLPIKEDMKMSIKALIARGLFGMEAYYEIMNQNDDIFLKAVDILKNNKTEKILKNN